MARYLTGESSAEESSMLEGMLEKDLGILKEFELCKALLLDSCTDESCSNDHFKRVSRRLKDEGLM